MSKELRLEDAGEDVARLVEEAESAGTVVLTRGGRTVACLTAVTFSPALAGEERERAIERMERRMAQGWPIGAGPLDRDEAHER
jgi:antitoxin (DNA-binding transcriptional repressor) of toxin-antitoxin stability system